MSTSPPSAERPEVLRWIIRVLGEDALLPLYLEDNPPAGALRREFELVYRGLAADSQHPEKARREAWKHLESMLDAGCRSYEDLYQAVIAWLRAHPSRPLVEELTRNWAWPDLTDIAAPLSCEGYHEIHAHFRGAIPFDHIWTTLMTDARARAKLRSDLVNFGWEIKTRATLAQRASKLRSCPRGHEAISEAEFRRHCINAVVTHGHDGRRDAMQYLAIYANFRRFFIYRRNTASLFNFTKSYRRLAELAKSRGGRMGDRRAIKALLERFEQSGASVVELRPTLDETRLATQYKLQSIILGYLDYLGTAERPVTLGLVPSFYKQEALNRRTERIHGCTDDLDLQARLDLQHTVWHRQLTSLFAMIDEVPALRLFIVGIDAAGLEQGAPVRVLHEIFARVHARHEASCRRRARPGRSLDIRPIQALCRDGRAQDAWEQLNRWRVDHCRLGLTVHVGEDFVDPMTGLREIWEGVTVLGLQRGDRIGHGIAAALACAELLNLLRIRADDPHFGAVVRKRTSRTYRLRKPVGLHALDLAWAHELLHGSGARNFGSVATTLAQAFGAQPLHHATFRSLRHGVPSQVTLPGVHFLDADALEPELHCWIEIDDSWCRDYEKLRLEVIKLLVLRGIVVESCPTSNRAVANLDEPPLLRLLEESRLQCAVATDDPGVLGAWPEHEIAATPVSERRRVLDTNAQACFVRRHD